MDVELAVAILSFSGTAIGALGGVLASSRLTGHRITELEKKMDKHNNIVQTLIETEQRSKSNKHRLDELDDVVDKIAPRRVGD